MAEVKPAARMVADHQAHTFEIVIQHEGERLNTERQSCSLSSRSLQKRSELGAWAEPTTAVLWARAAWQQCAYILVHARTYSTPNQCRAPLSPVISARFLDLPSIS